MLTRLRRLIVCFVLAVSVLFLWAMPSIFWGQERATGVPYGVIVFPGSDDLGRQDFAYNINFLDQIWEKTVDHPYRLEDQEKIVKNWYPRMATGLPHAYSPVAPVIALPLLVINPAWAYILFTLLNGTLLVALTCFYLLPRMKNSVQAAAVLASLLGFVLFDVFFMGQSSIVTTCLLAAGYALLSNLQKEKERANLKSRLILGGLLYVLAAKPSVALILIAMLLAEGAWAALFIGGLALGLTWLGMAGHYGGLVTGLQDYAWLLGHYCLDDVTPFMKAGMNPGISTNFTSFFTVLDPAHGEAFFQTSRILFEGLVVVLLVARWRKWISLETQFHGSLWTFLLFCPYLLVTEDFAICLLAVGTFFRPGLSAFFKVLLVFFLVNSCMGIFTNHPFFFPIKLVLAGWWLIDLLVFQPRLEKPASQQSGELASAIA